MLKIAILAQVKDIHLREAKTVVLVVMFLSYFILCCFFSARVMGLTDSEVVCLQEDSNRA